MGEYKFVVPGNGALTSRELFFAHLFELFYCLGVPPDPLSDVFFSFFNVFFHGYTENGLFSGWVEKVGILIEPLELRY